MSARTAEQVYDLREAAAIKRVSVDTLRRAIKAVEGNVLPAKKSGKGYTVKASELDAWYDRQPDA